MSIENEELLEVARKITLRHFPQEATLFEIEGPTILRDALDGAKPKQSKETADEFRFGHQDVIDGIKILSLLLATAKTIRDLLIGRQRNAPSIDVKELTERWQLNLVAQGLDPTTAKNVVNEFQADLITAIKKTHGN